MLERDVGCLFAFLCYNPWSSFTPACWPGWSGAWHGVATVDVSSFELTTDSRKVYEIIRTGQKELRQLDASPI